MKFKKGDQVTLSKYGQNFLIGELDNKIYTVLETEKFFHQILLRLKEKPTAQYDSKLFKLAYTKIFNDKLEKLMRKKK